MAVNIYTKTLLPLICCLPGIFTSLPGQEPGPVDSRAEPGRVFMDCRSCPEMIVLPAGEYRMGSPADEPERRDNEQHRTIIFRQAFAMSRTPVTWDQWEACVRDAWCDGPAVDQALRSKADGSSDPDYRDWGRGQRPVVGVSWYDAQHYVGWLNHKAGLDDRYHDRKRCPATGPDPQTDGDA